MPKHTDKPKRRVMKEFSISEISLVDNPAQPNARISLMKRADDVQKNKRALTTADAGHAHSMVLIGHDGSPMMSGQTSMELADDGTLHSHPWVANDAGEVTIGMAHGHMHGVAILVKNQDEAELTAEEIRLEKREFSGEERERLAGRGMALPDGSFPIVTKADLRNAIQAFGRAPEDKRRQVARHIRKRARALGAEDLLPEDGELARLAKGTLDDEGQNNENPTITANSNGETPQEHGKMTKQTDAATNDQAVNKQELDDLKKRNERLAQIVKLSPEQRAHFDKLPEPEQDEFLSKSSDERDAVLKNLRDSDPVVFKSTDGTEYRKSDDPRLVQMAKQADADRQELAKERAIAKRRDLEKRGTELFKNMKGESALKAELLGAVESIENEDTRGKVTEMLKQHDANLGKAFERVGSTDAPNSEGDTPSDQIDALAKAYAEKHSVDITKAYDEVLKTDEGKALYAKHIGR